LWWICPSVALCSVRLDQEQGFIELHVGVSKLESVKLAVVGPVGSAEEIVSGGPFHNGLGKHSAIFEAG
jgi:hypothetical protein